MVTDLVTVVAGPGEVRILNTDVEDAWTYWDEAWNRYARCHPILVIYEMPKVRNALGFASLNHGIQAKTPSAAAGSARPATTFGPQLRSASLTQRFMGLQAGG